MPKSRIQGPKAKTRISVVTVVRNEPRVALTVQSILAQKGVDLESVVVDGASNDGTLEALRPFKGKIRLISEADKGIYDAMNKGLKLARGRVIGFLNAGDVLEGNQSLAAVARAFDEDSKLKATFGGLEIVDAEGRVKRWWPAEPYLEGAFGRGWMPCHPTFYALRKELLDLGGFDIQYRLASDYDLMLRFLTSPGSHSVPLPLTLVRMQSGGASQASLGAVWRHNREAWAAARAAGATRASFPLFIARKIGNKVPQLFLRKRS